MFLYQDTVIHGLLIKLSGQLFFLINIIRVNCVSIVIVGTLIDIPIMFNDKPWEKLSFLTW